MSGAATDRWKSGGQIFALRMGIGGLRRGAGDQLGESEDDGLTDGSGTVCAHLKQGHCGCQRVERVDKVVILSQETASKRQRENQDSGGLFRCGLVTVDKQRCGNVRKL
jgi:hypothetical protein